eukprot:TRINITY_DN26660_c0_g1_i1.p1 TRINITY_DN26660_c0_g1~~TRINITY_DN26660_c0_g1_i1.p1  ORF type:complete len:332 (-),score=70.30 TRINITY_DN26660_c0_g1_i1:383-1378(-)
MSLLNSLFNRGLLGAKCKTCLNLAISRIKLLRNKREVQLKQMRKEISQFLQTGQEAIARIRVEHVIREQNILAAYAILELFCEFVLARVPILETQRECPSELQEAIASIIFAAPRCSDLPELMQIQSLFTAKYGKEFVAAASELRPDSSVNREIIEKLSVRTPYANVRLRLLKEIAHEYNVEWDSSSTEEEFSKKHEDLLAGSNQICSRPMDSRASITEKSPDVLLYKEGQPTIPTNPNQGIQQVHAPAMANAPSAGINSSLVRPDKLERPADSHGNEPSGDVMERARAAIASAERASAAAHAAAELMKIRVVPRPNNGNLHSAHTKETSS